MYFIYLLKRYQQLVCQGNINDKCVSTINIHNKKYFYIMQQNKFILHYPFINIYLVGNIYIF